MPNESSKNLRRVPLQLRDSVSNNYAQKQTLKTEEVISFINATMKTLDGFKQQFEEQQRTGRIHLDM